MCNVCRRKVLHFTERKFSQARVPLFAIFLWSDTWCFVLFYYVQRLTRYVSLSRLLQTSEGGNDNAHKTKRIIAGLGLSDLPIWLVVTICLSVGIGSLILCWLVGVPLLRRYIDKKFDENGIPRKTEEKHGDKTENQHLGLSGDGLEPFEPVEAKG